MDPGSRLRKDHLSGASELLGLAETAILAALASQGPGLPGFLGSLRRICRAQPSMAILQRLAARALETAETARKSKASIPEAASEIEAATKSFVRDQDEAAAKVIQISAAELVHDSEWVATYSRSSLVEAALLRAQERGEIFQVLLAESRPLFEGRSLAARLSKAGIPCWLTVDAALPQLLPKAELLLVGADAIRPRTFVNKVGTYPLLLVAREHNLPCYVLAQRAKFLPEDAGMFELVQRGSQEVWPDAPAGLRIQNSTFEEIPLSLTAGVVTEDGVIPPGEAGVAASETFLPPGLKIPWGEHPLDREQANQE